MREALLVFAGGGAGSVLRFAASCWLPRAPGAFPLAILLVNVAGCLALGALAGFAARSQAPSRDLLALLGVGFCGGFTTFSTFGLDAVELLREGRPGALLLYVGASVVLGVAAAALGLALAR